MVVVMWVMVVLVMVYGCSDVGDGVYGGSGVCMVEVVLVWV